MNTAQYGPTCCKQYLTGIVKLKTVSIAEAMCFAVMLPCGHTKSHTALTNLIA